MDGGDAEGPGGRTRRLHRSAQRCRDAPAGLILEGEAGIGKTTLWRAAVEQARQRGFRVLSRPVTEAETVLAYAGVGDLLGDVEPEASTPCPACSAWPSTASCCGRAARPRSPTSAWSPPRSRRWSTSPRRGPTGAGRRRRRAVAGPVQPHHHRLRRAPLARPVGVLSPSAATPTRAPRVLAAARPARGRSPDSVGPVAHLAACTRSSRRKLGRTLSRSVMVAHQRDLLRKPVLRPRTGPRDGRQTAEPGARTARLPGRTRALADRTPRRRRPRRAAGRRLRRRAHRRTARPGPDDAQPRASSTRWRPSRPTASSPSTATGSDSPTRCWPAASTPTRHRPAAAPCTARWPASRPNPNSRPATSPWPPQAPTTPPGRTGRRRRLRPQPRRTGGRRRTARPRHRSRRRQAVAPRPRRRRPLPGRQHRPRRGACSSPCRRNCDPACSARSR